MKKLFAALMSLCLILTGLTVFAESPAVNELNWADYQEAASKVEGQLAHLNSTDLAMFVPAQFKDSEISAEAAQQGHFLLLKSEDGKAVVSGQILPLSYDVFMSGVKDKVDHLSKGKVNGIECTTFTTEVDGVMNSTIVFSTNDGRVIVLTFSPSNSEAYLDLFKIMGASLQVQSK